MRNKKAKGEHADSGRASSRGLTGLDGPDVTVPCGPAAPLTGWAGGSPCHATLARRAAYCGPYRIRMSVWLTRGWSLGWCRSRTLLASGLG